MSVSGIVSDDSPIFMNRPVTETGGIITGGDRNDGYNWIGALADGESFDSMNPEEQAKVMEDIGVALNDDGAITAADGMRIYGRNFTAAELAFLIAASNEVPTGEGAG